jgi:hypothetical protein
VRKKKIELSNELDVYAKLAREHGMTYGKLQALETMGKVKVINNKLYKVKDGKYEPYGGNKKRKPQTARQRDNK